TNDKGEWRMILPSSFHMNGKNYLEIGIKEAHDTIAHGGFENTLKWLTDKFECQLFSRLVKEYVASCDTCQRTKYSNKPPLGQVTMLHVPARAWTDISMDFLKLSPIFIYCSTLYPNIPLEDDHMICFSKLWTIVCRHSGLMFLIPVPNNLTAEKCTDTFDTLIASFIGYPYCIVFDQDTVFMSHHFKDCAARKGVKLEPSTVYHPRTKGQSEIPNKAILQATQACKVEGNEWLHKLPEIQIKLNARDNAARQHSPFFALLSFEAKLGPSSFPCPINPFTPAEKCHRGTSRNLYSSKVKQAKQANKKRSATPLLTAGQKVLLSTENINLPNISRKLKPKWIGPFRIKHVNKKRNNYSLDLSTDRRLALIHDTFHVSKIKPYIENSPHNFPGRHDKQPGEINKGRWEVEKVLEYRTAPRTGKNQYLVRWKGYGNNDDEWINFEDISLEIVQDFWTSGNYSDTFKSRRSGKNHKHRRTRDTTKSIIQTERDRVLALSSEDHDITSAAVNVAEDIFNLFLNY
ncbi:MAG TPA: hypothetical protein VGM38_07715, partial [Pseudolysinimonas sp.]